MGFTRGGLWIAPSFINHSCIANTTRTFFGDVTVIKALEDLPKGTELTVQYNIDTPEYSARSSEIAHYLHYRHCGCKWCVDDRADGQDMLQERQRLTSEPWSELNRRGPATTATNQLRDYTVEELEFLVGKLDQTYRPERGPDQARDTRVLGIHRASDPPRSSRHHLPSQHHLQGYPKLQASARNCWRCPP